MPSRHKSGDSLNVFQLKTSPSFLIVFVFFVKQLKQPPKPPIRALAARPIPPAPAACNAAKTPPVAPLQTAPWTAAALSPTATPPASNSTDPRATDAPKTAAAAPLIFLCFHQKSFSRDPKRRHGAPSQLSSFVSAYQESFLFSDFFAIPENKKVEGKVSQIIL